MTHTTKCYHLDNKETFHININHNIKCRYMHFDHYIRIICTFHWGDHSLSGTHSALLQQSEFLMNCANIINKEMHSVFVEIIYCSKQSDSSIHPYTNDTIISQTLSVML